METISDTILDDRGNLLVMQLDDSDDYLLYSWHSLLGDHENPSDTMVKPQLPLSWVDVQFLLHVAKISKVFLLRFVE